jgi:hypothetical protein
MGPAPHTSGGVVGIVGAGVAAAVCARALASVGIRSTVYEQGRAAGGRLATRGSRSAPHQLDHGAPAFTCSTGGGEFGRMLAALEVEGAVREWAGCRLGVMDGRRRGLELVKPPGLRLYRGRPTMASLPAHLLASAAPHCEPRFGGLVESADWDAPSRRWRLGLRGRRRAGGGCADEQEGKGEVHEHEFLVVASSLPASSARWRALFGREAPLVTAAAGMGPQMQAAVAGAQAHIASPCTPCARG